MGGGCARASGGTQVCVPFPTSRSEAQLLPGCLGSRDADPSSMQSLPCSISEAWHHRSQDAGVQVWGTLAESPSPPGSGSPSARAARLLARLSSPVTGPWSPGWQLLLTRRPVPAERHADRLDVKLPQVKSG